MLHYKTIDPGTLELLNKLQAIPALQQVRLVGGTSLALQIGHRKSVDLEEKDLFKKQAAPLQMTALNSPSILEGVPEEGGSKEPALMQEQARG